MTRSLKHNFCFHSSSGLTTLGQDFWTQNEFWFRKENAFMPQNDTVILNFGPHSVHHTSVFLYAITRKRFRRERENEETGPGLIDGPVASEVKFRFSAKAPDGHKTERSLHSDLYSIVAVFSVVALMSTPGSVLGRALVFFMRHNHIPTPETWKNQCTALTIPRLGLGI